MYEIEMIAIDAVGEREARKPLLPGAIPGATVSLHTLAPGEELTREPAGERAFIFLSIDGKFTFAAGGENRAVSGRYVFIPSGSQRAQFRAESPTRLLEIVWEIPPNSREEWRDTRFPFPYVQEYFSAAQYRDRNKSDKTISRELVRQLLVLHTTMEWNNLIPSAADDPAYFQSIRDLLDGKLDGPWSMTVGTGFFYLPFILLLRAKEFYDIAIAFDYFSALVLAPAALALGFMILRRFGISGRAAFAAVLLWAVWPFFHTHLEAWEPFRCRSIFLAAPPSADSHWWLYYRTAINAGFNAMSDTPAMLLLFATIWSALTLPPRNRSAALIGVLFGFTCMVRINTILFAPLIAYLVFRRFRSRAGEWNAVLGVIASAAGGFLLGFGYQFYINIRQFGNPLTFGYISHYTDWAIRPADGFTFTTFLRWVHLRYLAQANWANWALGITGLLLAAGRTRRTAFALWTVPVIVFFTGYSHTFCDANRFIVSTLLPFFAAFTSLEIFREKGKLPWFFAGTVAAALLLTAPSSSQPEVPILLRFPAPAECTVLLPWLLAALLALLSWTGFRSGMRPLTAAAPALFAGLFFVGNSFLVLGLLGAILLRALAEWFLQWKRCAHRCRTP